MTTLDDALWPAARLGDLFESLARAAGLSDRRDSVADALRPALADTGRVDDNVRRAATGAGVDVESVTIAYADVDAVLAGGGPAVFENAGASRPSFLAVVQARRGRATVVGPDGRRRRIATAAIAQWLRRTLDATVADGIDEVLTDANVPPEAGSRVRQTWLDARLGGRTAARGWVLRPPPDGSWWRDVRHARLVRRFATFLAAYACAAAVPIAAWWLMGAAILSGQVSAGTLVAWAIVLLSLVPLGILALWSQGVAMIGMSGLVKQRLLTGALRLDPDETRHEGFGRHLARVIESSALESLALGGGFAAVAAVLDLILAAVIFAAVGAWWHLVVLAVVGMLFAALVVTYFSRRVPWTALRMRLTDGLVERMIGHRTRLAQESPVDRHREEDADLDAYMRASRRLDRTGIVLAAAPRLWLCAGIAAVVPAFIDDRTTMTSLTVVFGATLLGYGGFAKLGGGLTALADAAISWRQVRPLLRQARQREPAGDSLAVTSIGQSASGRPLVVARDLSFAFAARSEPVLAGCSFEIASGDRIHLSGRSGGGKSTLVSLLTGLRASPSGLLLIDGLDRATLGAQGWRRHVAAAPQFHENHLFNDTLAFNLLAGRRWPPLPEDLRDAELVCHRLQLGELIERMPAGLFQPVGETGWQLSHGERSRVFIARAVLQNADLLILDESFAELDPESLERCLPEIADLSNSLLVVAHR